MICRKCLIILNRYNCCICEQTIDYNSYADDLCANCCGNCNDFNARKELGI